MEAGVPPSGAAAGVLSPPAASGNVTLPATLLLVPALQLERYMSWDSTYAVDDKY
jgi:hypothetical protein